MNPNDPITMCAIIFLVTTITLSIGLAREHERQQEALQIAHTFQQELDQCVQDKAYSDNLELDRPEAARSTLPRQHRKD